MGMSRSEKEIAAAQKDLREQTSKAIKDFDTSGGFQRFAPSPLQSAMPQLKGSTSFLGGGVSPYAQSMAYQRLPGMTYANLPGTTTAFYPQANVPPVATTPPPSGGSGGGTSQAGSSFGSLPEDSQAVIASTRQDLNLPTFGSYEELVPKPIPQKITGNIGRQTRIKRENKEALERWNKGKQEFESLLKSSSGSEPEADIAKENELLIAELSQQSPQVGFERQGGVQNQTISRNPLQIEDYDDIFNNEDLLVSGGMPGGILSLRDLQGIQDSIGDNVMMTMAGGGFANVPVHMQGGGILGALGSLGSAAMTGMGKIGSAVGSGLKRLGGDQESEDEKKSPYENMTREQLIALLEKDKKIGVGDVGAGLTALSKSLMPQQLADGGNVDFPRMNGPISGPGTETSDDIPAMLSDGEFVVNAKAVRGVGKLNGANKTKEDQRREGARMMYALQKAGEQAMRKA